MRVEQNVCKQLKLACLLNIWHNRGLGLQIYTANLSSSKFGLNTKESIPFSLHDEHLVFIFIFSLRNLKWDIQDHTVDVFVFSGI